MSHHHHKPHRVKIHKWNNGQLDVHVHAFEDYYQAIAFAETQKYDPIRANWPVVKIVNENDEVVYQTSEATPSYA